MKRTLANHGRFCCRTSGAFGSAVFLNASFLHLVCVDGGSALERRSIFPRRSGLSHVEGYRSESCGTSGGGCRRSPSLQNGKVVFADENRISRESSRLEPVQRDSTSFHGRAIGVCPWPSETIVVTA